MVGIWSLCGGHPLVGHTAVHKGFWNTPNDFFSFEKPPTEFVLVEGFLVVVGKPMSSHFGAVLALCWANVGPMLGYVGPFGSMLGLCWGLW